MLCERCEQSFGPWDEYGTSFFRQDPRAHCDRTANADPDTVVVNEFDYPTLNLFVLSMLWRASASQRPEFAYVKLAAR
jgi:hypothetical protein